jgi:hypothetical protein
MVPTPSKAYTENPIANDQVSDMKGVSVWTPSLPILIAPYITI